MMVYVIDRRSPNPPTPSGIGGLARHHDTFESGWRRVIAEFPGHESAQMLFVDSAEPFRELAIRISATVSNPWSIYMLRIVCHGAPGYLQLGAGVGNREVRFFRDVRQAMTPAHLRGRGIEIHGCNVAEGRSGRRFVGRIASSVALPVVASPNVQYADNMFDFEGSEIVRIQP